MSDAKFYFFHGDTPSVSRSFTSLENAASLTAPLKAQATFDFYELAISNFTQTSEYFIISCLRACIFFVLFYFSTVDKGFAIGSEK